MASTGNHLAAETPDAVDERSAGCKYPAVEERIATPRRQRILRRIKTDDVSVRAHGKSCHVSAKRLGTACDRHLKQAPSGRMMFARCQHVATPVREALAVLKRTQLFSRIDQHVGVRAHAKSTARRQELLRRKYAVTKIRLGNRTQPGNRAACGQAMSFLRIHVRCMDQAPARIDRSVIKEPFDRTASTPRDAVRNLLRLFGDVQV